MKRMAMAVLVALLAACLGWASAARAEDAAPAKSEAKAKTGDAKAAKEAADTAKAGTVVTPYERKMADIQKLVDAADKAKESLFERDNRIAAEVGKMKGAKGAAVDTNALKDELSKNKASANAKVYRDLVQGLANYEQASIIKPLKEANDLCKDLLGGKAPDDDLKSKGETLAKTVKDDFISALVKVAGVYERIADEGDEAAMYKMVLTLDKGNLAATKYFKDLEDARKKAEAAKKPATGGGGGTGYSKKY